MDSPVQNKVFGIVSRIAGTKKISGATSINHDLPVDGDDAYELLMSIKNEFGTDFDGFDFYRYFRDEGAVMFPSGLFRRFYKKKNSLTIQHLIDVVEKGSWFD
jgi:hypothetical protein